MAGAGGRVEAPRVGLIPAAGRATRLAPLPCSKEVLPVRFEPMEGGGLRPRTTTELLLRQMRDGGARRAILVLRDGKWDIPGYFGAGEMVGMDLAYVMAATGHGVPFTLDSAHFLLDDAVVLMAFPDIVVEPANPFGPAVDRLVSSDADLVLGLFPSNDPQVWDQVRLEGGRRVTELRPRPGGEPLDYSWGLAAWAPSFTRFLHDRVAELLGSPNGPRTPDGREVSMGHVIADAVERGLTVEGVPIPSGSLLDVGTPAGLARALRWSLGASE